MSKATNVILPPPSGTVRHMSTGAVPLSNFPRTITISNSQDDRMPDNNDTPSQTTMPTLTESLFGSGTAINSDLLKSLENRTKKAQLEKSLIEDLKQAHPGNTKRQLQFQEDVLAAYHLRYLSTKYGSKGKPGKQFFMESCDNETKLIQGKYEELKTPSQRYDWKGREKRQRHSTKLEVKNGAEDSRLVEVHPNVPCSPIILRSLEVLPDGNIRGANSESDASQATASSTVNFWASMDRLQKKDERKGSDLSLCPVDGDAAFFFEMSKSANKRETDTFTNSYDSSVCLIKESTLDKYLEPLQEVVLSAAVKKTWERIQHHLEKCKVHDPMAYKMFGQIYEETRDFVKLPEEDVEDFYAGNWEPEYAQPEAIFKMEAPEKLFSRFSVYQKALIYMIEHFETLRPILSEIKQAYSDVLDNCEKEWSDLDKFRLDLIRLRETFTNYVRQKDEEGDKALNEVKNQVLALQDNLKCQQHTLSSIVEVLWRVRSSLKSQHQLVRNTSVLYRKKIEILAKEIVSEHGQGEYEMALPGKFHEVMAKFKTIKDPHEVRAILQSARRQLKKANKQIVLLEADYADTVPKAEWDLYKTFYDGLKGNNQIVLDKCENMRQEIKRIKESISNKNRVMVNINSPEGDEEEEMDEEEEDEGEGDLEEKNDNNEDMTI